MTKIILEKFFPPGFLEADSEKPLRKEGDQGIVSGDVEFTIVTHNADATVERPDANVVHWIGTVEPDNKTSADLWLHGINLRISDLEDLPSRVSALEAINPVVVFEHGSDASAERPDAKIVYWIGEVEPINKIVGDFWLDESEGEEEEEEEA